MVLGFNSPWLHLFHSILSIDHMGVQTKIGGPGVERIQRKMGCFVLWVKDRKIRSSHLLSCFHWKEVSIRATLLDWLPKGKPINFANHIDFFRLRLRNLHSFLHAFQRENKKHDRAFQRGVPGSPSISNDVLHW
jgi:hypothetical protein